MTRFKVFIAICSLAMLALVAGCKKEEAAAADPNATVPNNPNNARGGEDLKAGEMTPGPGAGNAETRVNSATTGGGK